METYVTKVAEALTDSIYLPLSLMGVIASVAFWVSAIDTRVDFAEEHLTKIVEKVEEDTATQYEYRTRIYDKINDLKTQNSLNSSKLARIEGKLDVLIELKQNERR